MADSQRPWWRQPDPEDESHEPGSHLARSMAYESLVIIWSFLWATVVGFVVFGGRFEDLYIKLRAWAQPSGQVAVVSIGPEALYLWDPALGEDPETTPRELLAEIVDFCTAAGADVVVLDVLLDRPVAGDERLAEAARRHGRVVGAERFAADPGGEFLAAVHPGFSGALSGGFANLQVEEPWLFAGDRIVRKAPLARVLNRARVAAPWPMGLVGAEQADAVRVPSMALRAAWLAHHPGARPEELDALVQSCPSPCMLDGLDLEEPVGINFRGPESNDPIPVVDAASILRAAGQAALARAMGVEMPLEVPATLDSVLRGRVVVVGRQSASDRFVTPYAFPLLLEADMAGLRVQAQLIDTLIDGKVVRPWGKLPSWILGVLLAASVVLSWKPVRDDVHMVGWIAIASLLVGLGAFTFRVTDGVALELGPALAGILVPLTFVHLRGWAIEESRRT